MLEAGGWRPASPQLGSLQAWPWGPGWTGSSLVIIGHLLCLLHLFLPLSSLKVAVGLEGNGAVTGHWEEGAMAGALSPTPPAESREDLVSRTEQALPPQVQGAWDLLPLTTNSPTSPAATHRANNTLTPPPVLPPFEWSPGSLLVISICKHLSIRTRSMASCTGGQ